MPTMLFITSNASEIVKALKNTQAKFAKRKVMVMFLFQAEDGIRGAQESRGLGYWYKRQHQDERADDCCHQVPDRVTDGGAGREDGQLSARVGGGTPVLEVGQPDEHRADEGA